MDKQWVVYILECGDNTLYTGITNDLERRLKQHNTGKGARYTRGRGPLVLRALFHFENRSEATKEEFRIKHLSRESKFELISIYDKKTL